MKISDEKLVENYERMFDMPAWRAFTGGLQEQYTALCNITTMAEGETLEARKARLEVLSTVISFEPTVRAMVTESREE